MPDENGVSDQQPQPARERFLTALGEGLSVAGAAKLAGVGRQTVYDWRKRDAAFASAWDDAIETGTDNLEDEARRRAMSSSDTLMIFMLKARRPEKYKERRASEVSGPGGGPIQTEWDYSKLSLDDLEVLERLYSKMAGEPAQAAGTAPDLLPSAT
jgi:hypothetical protein